MDDLAAALVASLMDFDETDLMPMECTTCGHRCANRIESMIHTKETGHPSFSQKVRRSHRVCGGQGRNDRTPNPMACRTCGHMCANRAESWEHTEATGHTGFQARKSMVDQRGNRKQAGMCRHGSYKVGDQVTALRRITHQGADVKPGTQGTIQRIDSDCDIHIKWENGYMNCGLQPGDFKLHSVGAADVSGQIRVGSLVMVKEEVKNPTYNWGAVSPGDCGTVHELRLVQTSDMQERNVRVLTQRMHRGSSGLAGGGIYFAETKDQKLTEMSTFGLYFVDLGRIKEVRSSAQSMTFTALRAEGYDSVKILGRASGTEFVVYDWDQVGEMRWGWVMVWEPP
eukprot:Skav232119  [mRNA]  locus=scaffold2353:156916:161202:+ [translate_table: standard]